MELEALCWNPPYISCHSRRPLLQQLILPRHLFWKHEFVPTWLIMLGNNLSITEFCICLCAVSSLGKTRWIKRTALSCTKPRRNAKNIHAHTGPHLPAPVATVLWAIPIHIRGYNFTPISENSPATTSQEFTSYNPSDANFHKRQIFFKAMCHTRICSSSYIFISLLTCVKPCYYVYQVPIFYS